MNSEASFYRPQLEKRHRLIALVLLSVIVLVAAGLRLSQARESLWVDELHTAWTVSAGVEQVVPRANIGNQSPLYFLLIWAVTQTFSMSEPALRLPSILAGLLLVPGAYFAIYGWTRSHAAGLLAAILVTIDRDLLFYSGEARPYALVQLTALVHILLFWNLIRAASQKELHKNTETKIGLHSRFWRPIVFTRFGFIASAVLLFYLHYTAILLVVAEIVIFGFLRCQRWSLLTYKSAEMFFDLGIIFLLCLPATPHLLQIAANRHHWEVIVSRWPTLMLLRWDLYILFPLILLSLIGLFRWATARKVFPIKLPNHLILFMVCWIIVPVAIVWIATLTDGARLSMRRYIAVSMPAPLLFVGICCAMCSSRASKAIFISLVLAVVVCSNGVWAQYRLDGRLVGDRNENWKLAIQQINKENNWKRFPVLVYSGLIESDSAFISQQQGREYSLLPVTGIYQVDRDYHSLYPLPTVGPIHFDQPLEETIQKAGGAWVLIRRPISRAGEIVNRVEKELEPLRYQKVAQHNFGTVTLVRIAAANH